MSEINTKVLLKGIGASPGLYRGKVTVIDRGGSNILIKSGEVIVIDFLTPMEIPHILEAGAIITDHGGVTSHAAVIARELGIPCIVSTGKATKLLKDGMEVIVDGKKGIIYKP